MSSSSIMSSVYKVIRVIEQTSTNPYSSNNNKILSMLQAVLSKLSIHQDTTRGRRVSMSRRTYG